jgi:hypothetical protein
MDDRQFAADMWLVTSRKDVVRIDVPDGSVIVLLTKGSLNKVMAVEPGGYEIVASSMLAPDAEPTPLGVMVVDARHARSFMNMPIEMIDGMLEAAQTQVMIDIGEISGELH